MVKQLEILGNQGCYLQKMINVTVVVVIQYLHWEYQWFLSYVPGIIPRRIK